MIAQVPDCEAAPRAHRGGAPVSILVEIPMPLPSVANLREHYMRRAKRAASQRRTVAIVMRSRVVWTLLPCSVTLTRVAPRPLDGDNLQHALKPARDGVADYLGVRDNDPSVTWLYDQARGKPRYQALRVEVSA